MTDVAIRLFEARIRLRPQRLLHHRDLDRAPTEGGRTWQPKTGERLRTPALPPWAPLTPTRPTAPRTLPALTLEPVRAPIRPRSAPGCVDAAARVRCAPWRLS